MSQIDSAFAAFAGPISTDALKDTSDLDQRVRRHLQRVYSTLAVCTAFAAAGSAVHMYTDVLRAGLLPMLGGMALLILLGMTPDLEETHARRVAYLLGFAFLQGVGVGPLLEAVAFIDPAIIVTAFLGTTAVFACFSVAALLAERRSYLYLGGFLSSALSLLFFLSFANLFMQSAAVFSVQLYGGLLLMSGFVLYDTQLIVEKARAGSDDYLWHGAGLFIDFVGIFVRILIILAKNRDGRRDDRRRR